MANNETQQYDQVIKESIKRVDEALVEVGKMLRVNAIQIAASLAAFKDGIDEIQGTFGSLGNRIATLQDKFSEFEHSLKSVEEEIKKAPGLVGQGLIGIGASLVASAIVLNWKRVCSYIFAILKKYRLTTAQDMLQNPSLRGSNGRRKTVPALSSRAARRQPMPPPAPPPAPAPAPAPPPPQAGGASRTPRSGKKPVNNENQKAKKGKGNDKPSKKEANKRRKQSRDEYLGKSKAPKWLPKGPGKGLAALGAAALAYGSLSGSAYASDGQDGYNSGAFSDFMLNLAMLGPMTFTPLGLAVGALGGIIYKVCNSFEDFDDFVNWATDKDAVHESMKQLPGGDVIVTSGQLLFPGNVFENMKNESGTVNNNTSSTTNNINFTATGVSDAMEEFDRVMQRIAETANRSSR